MLSPYTWIVKAIIIPFTLQAVCPIVMGIGQNAPVFQLSSYIHIQTCNTVAKCPIS